MAESIRLSPTSRYRNTRVYTMTDPRTGKNVSFFGVWRPPEIIETRPPIRHTIAVDEIRRPDLLSFRVYGQSDLFWAIAMRNNWLLPILEIRTGRTIYCPHLDDIYSALNSSFGNNPGTT